MSDQYPTGLGQPGYQPGAEHGYPHGRGPHDYPQQHEPYPTHPERFYGQPPPPVGAYGPPAPYASWWSRVGAVLIDSVIAVIPTIILIIIGSVITGSTAETDPLTGETTGVNPLGPIVLVLGFLVGMAVQIWNQGIRQGRIGNSIGKGVLAIAVVREADSRYQGAGMGFVRWLMYYIFGSLCFLDYLWPLWDAKNQTWHDKVVGSVVVRRP